MEGRKARRNGRAAANAKSNNKHPTPLRYILYPHPTLSCSPPTPASLSPNNNQPHYIQSPLATTTTITMARSFAIVSAIALLAAAPFAGVLAQAAEAPCPAVTRFPAASTDGSSIGIVAECARACLQMSNAVSSQTDQPSLSPWSSVSPMRSPFSSFSPLPSPIPQCVCGSTNPFADRNCVCTQEKFEDDFVGCAQSDCAGAADINKFRAYKTGFCSGTIKPPAGPAAPAKTTSKVVASTTRSVVIVPTSTSVIANRTVSANVTTSAVTSSTSAVASVTLRPSAVAPVVVPALTSATAAAAATGTNSAQNNAAVGSGAFAALMGVIAAALA
ncbi:uncharacterized protein EV422DRAFT_540897 [Fimicolochytrium jonesii]|uniref:uncharacterized protein n=1 Tax=Fimicolochytrium jonesii TaxID=1396493 RepID=UPI0022FE89E5|nr:uncharacterized protein EV422DRAFT_540897 [Fimicolochytrium jonesii]KAI8817499.1 hypothetical protein EV422DRAFT_540897 [Fimicolochytrium jonesii]